MTKAIVIGAAALLTLFHLCSCVLAGREDRRGGWK